MALRRALPYCAHAAASRARWPAHRPHRAQLGEATVYQEEALFVSRACSRCWFVVVAQRCRRSDAAALLQSVGGDDAVAVLHGSVTWCNAVCSGRSATCPQSLDPYGPMAVCPQHDLAPLQCNSTTLSYR